MGLVHSTKCTQIFVNMIISIIKHILSAPFSLGRGLVWWRLRRQLYIQIDIISTISFWGKKITISIISFFSIILLLFYLYLLFSNAIVVHTHTYWVFKNIAYKKSKFLIITSLKFSHCKFSLCYINLKYTILPFT